MHKHISEQYDAELAQIADLLMEMGGLTESQLNNSFTALITNDFDMAETVRDVESKLNQLEVELDGRCVAIIARRQPTAGDLRNVISVMKASTDLERVGDEADRIAKLAIEMMDHPTNAVQNNDLRNIHSAVVKMLRRALDAFARMDIESALRVIDSDAGVDRAYKKLVGENIDQMRTNPQEIERNINIIWIARALERIGDHAKNISEYVIYRVKGQDVRHGGTRIEADNEKNT